MLFPNHVCRGVAKPGNIYQKMYTLS
jgi:hypothetical protein